MSAALFVPILFVGVQATSDEAARQDGFTLTQAENGTVSSCIPPQTNAAPETCGLLTARYATPVAKPPVVATRARHVMLWSSDDYPKEARRKREFGTSFIRWEIGTDARITSCVIEKSSGSADLDRVACEKLLRRAAYEKPARDAAGRPIVSFSTRRVVWQLP